MSTTKRSTLDEEGIIKRIHDAGDRIIDLKDGVAKSINQKTDSLGSVMKKHPIVVAAAAIGIGYLIARLVHR